MLVYKNKGIAAILVYKANPMGIELYFYVNIFFYFHWTNRAAGHGSENDLLLQ